MKKNRERGQDLGEEDIVSPLPLLNLLLLLQNQLLLTIPPGESSLWVPCRMAGVITSHHTGLYPQTHHHPRHHARVNRGEYAILYEKTFDSKLSGSEVYYTT